MDDGVVERTDDSAYHVLGYPNADEMVAKALMVRKIHDAIETQGLSRARAAEIVGLDERALDRLLRGIMRQDAVDDVRAALDTLERCGAGSP